MSLSDRARGLRVLSYYFGGMPLWNRRLLRTYEEEGFEAARRRWLGYSGRALELAGAEVNVIGEEHIPERGCVFVYNESSLVDLVLLHRVIYEHADAGTAAEIFARIPWSREIAEKFRVVIFERGNRNSAPIVSTPSSWKLSTTSGSTRRPATGRGSRVRRSWPRGMRESESDE